MATIAENPGLTTLVVVFKTTPDEQGELSEHLVKTAHQHSHHDGFVSCSIHTSTDGVRIVEYIQWRSMAHLQAMIATPQGRSTFTAVAARERCTSTRSPRWSRSPPDLDGSAPVRATRHPSIDGGPTNTLPLNGEPGGVLATQAGRVHLRPYALRRGARGARG